MEGLPSSAMGCLRLMPSTASQIGQFSKQLIEGVQEGNINAIELLVMLRALEGVSETVRDAIKSNIESAADKYNEKSFEVFGARVEKSEVGVSYNYEVCGDQVWERHKVDERTASTLRKEREAFLRMMKEPLIILDKDSGEVITINPPLKRSQSGLKVFLK